MQDIFHSSVHWLQACGIYRKIVDSYDTEPLIPLPKVRSDEALGADQLIMLWLIWACGLALGILAFMFELCTSVSFNNFNRHVTSSKHDKAFAMGRRGKLEVNVNTIKVQEYLSTM